MASAADRAFGEIDSDVTDEELAAMKRAGVEIGRRVGHSVATRYSTRQTVEVLDHLVEVLSEWASAVTIEKVRQDATLVKSGQPSRLFVGIDPETTKKAALYDQATDESNPDSLASQVKKLQDAATSSGSQALGAGGINDKLEKIRLHGESDPATLDFVLELLDQLKVLPQGEAVERSIVAGNVIRGAKGYQMVDDPTGGERKPQIVVAANVAYQSKAKEVTDRVKDIQDLQQKLDPKVTDSYGWKAGWYDADHNPSDPNSLISKLNAATAKLSASGGLDKSKLQATVKEAKNALSGVTGFGKAPLEKKLNELDAMVK